MITYQEEKYEDILDELKLLFVDHWEELANNKDIRPLDPDHDRYIIANQLGIIRVYTARSEGILIGYAFFVIGLNLHYKTWKYGVCDIYYIKPEHRRAYIGTGLVQFSEARLIDDGCKSITIQEKILQQYEDFFPKLGYTTVELHHEKIL